MTTKNTAPSTYVINKTKRGYTNKTAIENYLLTEIDASFDTQINDWIEAVEEYIERETGRVFIADKIATRRDYSGDGEPDIFIDPCVGITKVEIGSEEGYFDEVDREDYVTCPSNARARNMPIDRIELIGAIFPTYPDIAHVTAYWGSYEFCPKDIELCATILVAGIINFANKVEGEIKQMTIGRYSVTYKDAKGWDDLENVRRILDGYRTE